MPKTEPETMAALWQSVRSYGPFGLWHERFFGGFRLFSCYAPAVAIQEITPHEPGVWITEAGKPPRFLLLPPALPPPSRK